MVLDQWFMHTLCVRYFTELRSGPFDNRSVNEIKHYLLAILIGLLRDHSIYN